MIREIRTLTGISHEQLAAWLGVSRTMVQFAEKGERSLSGNASKKLLLLATPLQHLKDGGTKNAPAIISGASATTKKHRLKMEYHLYRAGKMQRQLKLLLPQQAKISSGLTLLEAMKEIDKSLHSSAATKKNLTGLLEFFGRDKLDTVTKKIELLQDSVATHLAYAEVHERRLEELQEMGKKRKKL